LAELQAAFVYDETSKSCIRLRVAKYRGRYRNVLVGAAGDEVGCLHKASGYYVTRHKGMQLQCHRIAYCLANACELDADEEVDHADGNRANNRAGNLCKVTATGNAKNKARYKNNSSGVTGVRRFVTKTGFEYYVARVGNDPPRYFSILVLGEQGAFNAAVRWRESEAEAAAYTERHGT
jgi:hypothetical protein